MSYPSNNPCFNPPDQVPITTTDPQGRQMVRELNGFNQPIKITDAAGRITTLSYEPNFQQLIQLSDPLGRLTRFAYDLTGNLTTASDPDGNQSTFTYNAQGQVLNATNALGQTVKYQYNSNHDLVQVTDALGNNTSFTYDNLSRLTQITDAKGNKTQYAYDLLNRVTSITDALGHITKLSYDENGNLISVTDPKGHVITASYDPMNRLIATTNAKGETVSLNYDGAGNIISTTDAKGQTQQFNYDADDRKTQMQAADGTIYKYTYDNLNRLTGINDGVNTWSFAYDILDRLISQGTPQGSLTFTYDTVSRLTGFSAPNTNYQPVQYAYDNLDRVISIAQNNKTYQYSYDSIGRRTGLTRPNGVTSTYEYDNGNRLQSLTHNKGTQVLERHAYTYDANGNITQYVRGKGTSQPVVIKPCGKNGKGQLRQIVGFMADTAETLTRTYQYDALNRLTDVQGIGIVASASNFRNPGNLIAASTLVEMAQKLNNAQAQRALLRNAELLGAALPESASWSFDENGNITSKTIHTTTQDKLISYTYDEADRLVSLTRPVDEDLSHAWPGHFHWHYPTRGGAGRMPQTETVSLTYDANGNLINDSTGRQFTWNALDQLTQMKTSDMTASFAYDPLGRRTSYTKGSTLKTYLLNGLDVLNDGSSNFLHGIGVDEHLQVNTSTGSMSYLNDHLGSTSQLIDSINALSKARIDYKSYGKLEGDNTNPVTSNPYTYTGRGDDGTGLMYYRNRYYDPELEVFISQDPLGDAQRYVKGNPLSFTDPLGLWYWDANVTVGLGLGITTGLFVTPQGIYPYAGGGIVSSPGGSLNWSPADISPGKWSGQAALAIPILPSPAGPSLAAGADSSGNIFSEVGVGTAGFSLTGYYTTPAPFEPWNWLNGQNTPTLKKNIAPISFKCQKP